MDADLQRVDPHGVSDVLQLFWAEVRDGETKPPFHLPISVLGQTDRARRTNAFEAGSEIDAVAHEIAVALLDNVAEVNTDAKLDPPVRRNSRVALEEAVLHFDCAAHRVDHAAEFDEAAVASVLDDPAVMRADGGINQIAAQPPEPRQRAVLVRARETAIADDIGD